MVVSEKRGIGRPIKLAYVKLLLSLEDDTLYSYAMIAARFVDRSRHRRSYENAKAAMRSRAAYRLFPKGGDGQVQLKGQAETPAWFGWRWKEGLSETDLNPPQKSASTPRKANPRGPGAKFQNSSFILGLDPFRLYSVDAIVAQGEKRGLFPESLGFKELKRKKAQTFHSLNYRRKRYIRVDKPDGYLDRANGKSPRAYYGWRWLLTLPDYCFSAGEKAALRAQVAACGHTPADDASNDLPLPNPPASPSKWFRFPLHWKWALQAALLSGTVVFAAVWTWHRIRMEELLEAERKTWFLEWKPMKLSRPYEETVHSFAVSLETFLQIPVKVREDIQSERLIVDPKPEKWHQVLQKNNLKWRITKNGEVEIFH